MTTTGKPITDLPFAKWTDDLAWMEFMRGPQWRRALTAEQRALTIVQNIPAVRRCTGEFANILKKGHSEQKQYKNLIKLPRNIPAPIRDENNDFDLSNKGSAVLISQAKGSEFVTVAFFKTGARVPSWKRANVGGTVAIRDDRIYYVRADPATNRDYAVESAALETGGDVKVLYKNNEPTETIHLIKGEAGALFIFVERSSKTALYHLETGGSSCKSTLLDDKSHSQILLGLAADGTPTWIANDADGTQRIQSASGQQQMPALPADGFVIYAGSVQGRWLIGNLNGCQRLYMSYGDPNEPFKKVHEVIGGQIIYEEAVLAASPAGQVPAFLIESAGEPPQRLLIADGIAHTHKLVAHIPTYAITQSETTSHDGKHVHFLTVRKGGARTAPTGLLVYGYGSYGSQTPIHRMRTHFAPLLEKGWAIAVAFIRGGGDSNEAWSLAGRNTLRENSLQDFEAVIRAARGRLHVPAERTVITGRSAGGMLVGAMVSRHLDGTLFKGVFAEVPFVDGLRTMSNLAYPMTTPELGEYGNPAKSLTEFMTVFEISATNMLPVCGAPAIFVFARTGENDSQVLAYEPLKWIWRLRGEQGAALLGPPAAEGKLFAFGKSQGHTYDEEGDIKARSGDLAVIHNWVTQPAVREKIARLNIEMASRKNVSRRRSTRKNTKKSVKRATTRKARKASRKNRKH